VQAGNAKRKFKPGDLAPITGVYMVVHGSVHRPPHEAVIIRGEQLPACRTCKLDVYFTVVQPMSHITHDWDFSGPEHLIIRRKQEPFQEFRIFSRVPVHLPMTVEFGRSGNVIQGQCSDLSAGGVGAIIRDRLPAKCKSGVVKIDVTPGKNPLRLRAQFRYQNGLRCGFEFSTLSAAERETIRQLIRSRRGYAVG